MSVKPITPPLYDVNVVKINGILQRSSLPCNITLPINTVGDLNGLVQAYRDVGWVVDYCSDYVNHYLVFRNRFKWMSVSSVKVGLLQRIKQFFKLNK